MTPPSGEQFELVRGTQRAVVGEAGGGLRPYGDILLGYGLDEMCAAARGGVLAPWPNRIAGGTYAFDGETYQLAVTEPKSGSAIPGLVRWASWQAVERDESRVVMEHLLPPQPGYPFPLELQVEYALLRDGPSLRPTAGNIGQAGWPLGP